MHAISILAIFALLAASVSWMLSFPTRSILSRRSVLDVPNERSSHTVKIVRGGGIAPVITICGFLALWGGKTERLLIPMIVMLALVSFYDDLKSLRWSIRVIFHGLAALGVLLLFSPYGELFPLYLHTYEVPGFVVLCLGFFWIVGYTNSFNFMDGINGLAAAQVVVTCVGSMLVALVDGGFELGMSLFFGASLAGAALGFLPHNFPRPRMFLGDVGSIVLGYSLAVLVVWIVQDFGYHLLIPLLLLQTNFVLDTGLTFFRRLYWGQPCWQAHREHFYQRLIRSGLSHSRVTGLQMGLQTLTLLLSLAYTLSDSMIGRVLLIVAVLAIWLSFYVYSDRRFLSLTK